MSANLERLLIVHEGSRALAYDDATGMSIRPGDYVSGAVTIGVGRNLVRHGLSPDEITLLLRNDLALCRRWLHDRYTWFDLLGEVRQAVIIDMAFMGFATLATFTTFLSLIADEAYEDAAADLETTKWYRQVGQRGKDAAAMLRTNRWPWEGA